PSHCAAARPRPPHDSRPAAPRRRPSVCTGSADSPCSAARYRPIGVAGLLIPIVSVIAACTLLPAMLAIIGTGINRVRVMPRRFISQADPDAGPWARWARLVTHHAGVMAALGIAIVVVVMIPAISLNPGDALAKNMPGSGPAI